MLLDNKRVMAQSKAMPLLYNNKYFAHTNGKMIDRWPNHATCPRYRNATASRPRAFRELAAVEELIDRRRCSQRRRWTAGTRPTNGATVAACGQVYGTVRQTRPYRAAAARSRREEGRQRFPPKRRAMCSGRMEHAPLETLEREILRSSARRANYSAATPDQA